MNIEFYCPRWGSEHLPWKDFCTEVSSAGYNGIEYAIGASTDNRELDEAWNAAAQQRLKIITQHYDTATPDFNRHRQEYADWWEKIKNYPVTKINSQTGRDFFPYEQNVQLIKIAADHARQYNVPVVHETHRGKFSFALHITAPYLQQIPELRITLDASHWVNTAESFLHEQETAMQLALQRADHIHARVGYPEGPQVPDPRAAEWGDALQEHLKWWDKVVELKKAADEDLTISPEFGPFPYLVHLPFTKQPIASQWDINVYMMELLKNRYAVK